MSTFQSGVIVPVAGGFTVTKELAGRPYVWGPYRTYAKTESVQRIVNEVETPDEAVVVEDVLSANGDFHRIVGVYMNWRYSNFSVQLCIAGEKLYFGSYGTLRKANLVAAQAWKIRSIPEAFALRVKLGLKAEVRQDMWFNHPSSRNAYNQWLAGYKASLSQPKPPSTDFSSTMQKLLAEAEAKARAAAEASVAEAFVSLAKQLESKLAA